MRILWHAVYHLLFVPVSLFMLLGLAFMLFLEETNHKLVDKFDDQFRSLIERISK